MFRLLSLITAFTALNAQTNGTQCGGTTGFPCPSSSSTPTQQCCDPSKTQCPAGDLICPSASPIAPRCCDITTNNCLPTDLICGVNMMTINGTTVQCCPPQMTCYTPMPVCPDCCDPLLYRCPTNATLCRQPSPSLDPSVSAAPSLQPSRSALPSTSPAPSVYPSRSSLPSSSPHPSASLSSAPSPRPSISPAPTCCLSNCSATDLMCGMRIPTVNGTVFECCSPGMNCYKPMPTCPMCCDPKVFVCPTDAPICQTPPPTQNATCCDPMSDMCPPESLACGIRVMTVNDTLFECCPSEMKCYKPMAVCPDCCDPRIFKCPADAPLCSAAANNTFPPRPSTMPGECCDVASGACTPQTPVCGIKVPLINNTWFECCPFFPVSLNFTCYKPMPTCPTCCDPTFMRCPTDAPLCEPSPRPSFSMEPKPSASVLPPQPSSDLAPSIIPPSMPAASRPPPPTPSAALPSQSAAPSRLVQPSAAPTQRPLAPSAAPTQRPTMLPAATRYLRAAVSMAPSRSAPPPSFTPVVYMPVLASTIRIAGANQTSAVSPANLQMTQANLACAIGVPQQNIQIRNVTVVYTNGTRKVLPFDPAVTQLNSGSDVVCLAPTTRTNTTTTVARRLKQVTYTIEITYDIVDPPLVVLSMDGATFMASLENTTAMADLVLALEGTGVSVEAPPELALGIGAAAVTTASSAPVTITSSSTNISQGPLLYGVIGAIVGAIVVLGVGVGFIIIRLQQRLPTSVATPPQKTTETKIVYVVENPMQGPAPKEEDAAARNNYNPVGVRRI